MSRRLIFLDADDTFLTPPYQATVKAARLMGIKFPPEQEFLDRSKIQFYEAFPELFKNKAHMWKVGLLSIPFGFIRSQKIYDEIDVEDFAQLLRNENVYVLTKNPPMFSRMRIRRIAQLTGVNIQERYLPCGPIRKDAPSKVRIMEAMARLNNVPHRDCLLIDDSHENIEQAQKLGFTVRLLKANWNRDFQTDSSITRREISSTCQEFLQVDNGDEKVDSDDGGATENSSSAGSVVYLSPYKHFFAKSRMIWQYLKFCRRYNKKIFPLPQFDCYNRIRDSKNALPEGKAWLQTNHEFAMPFKSAADTSARDLINALQVLNKDLIAELGLFTETYTKPEVTERIGGLVRGSGKEKFIGYARGMLSGRYPWGVLVGSLGFRFLTGRIFRKVTVKSDYNLAELEANNFVIYLPQHRSIFDSLLLVKILSDLTSNIPIIAAADKMAKSIVGIGGKMVGTYFIRREGFDATYFKLLRGVVDHALTHSSSAAIYLEGQRSRSGLTLEPKSGLLKQFVSQAKKKGMNKVIFVPISFAYSKLPEAESLVDEVYSEQKESGSVSAGDASNMIIRRSRKKSSIAKFLTLFFRKNVSDAFMTVGKPIPITSIPFQADITGGISTLLYQCMTRNNSVVAPLASSMACCAIYASKTKHLSIDSLSMFLNTCDLIINMYPTGQYKSLIFYNSRDFIKELELLPFVNRKFKDKKIRQYDFICITDLDLVIASHYVNNVLHYFAFPAIFAFLIKKNRIGKIDNLVREFYFIIPEICDKFFIPNYFSKSGLSNKLVSFFNLIGVIKLDENNKYEYIEQPEDSPFNLLISLSSLIIPKLSGMFLEILQRKRDRFKIAFPITVKRMQDNSMYPAKILDISQTGGACRLQGDSLQVGEQLEIIFDPESGSEKNEGNRLAEVVRISKDTIGFKFLHPEDVN